MRKRKSCDCTLERGPPKAEARAVIQRYIPPVMDSVLGNYYMRNIAGPQVVSLAGGKLRSHVTQDIAEFVSSVFRVTFDMENGSFLKQVYLCSLRCVPVPRVHSAMWGMKHMGRSITDTVRCCDDTVVVGCALVYYC